MATAAFKGKARAVVAAPFTHQADMLRLATRAATSPAQQRWTSRSAAMAAEATPGSQTSNVSSSASLASMHTSSRSSGVQAQPASTLASDTASLDAPKASSSREALALLRSQPTHYVVASIAGRTLMLHTRDLFTLPRLNDLQVGDVIELDRIHEVGSRDYTLRAQDPMNTRQRGQAALIRRSNSAHPQLQTTLPLSAGMTKSGSITEIETAMAAMSTREALDQGLPESQSWAARLRPGGLAHIGAVLTPGTVRVRCTVVEHTKGRMEFIVKFKRRQGYKRTIRHKQTYTRLRVDGVQLGSGEAGM